MVGTGRDLSLFSKDRSRPARTTPAANGDADAGMRMDPPRAMRMRCGMKMEYFVNLGNQKLEGNEKSQTQPVKRF